MKTYKLQVRYFRPEWIHTYGVQTFFAGQLVRLVEFTRGDTYKVTDAQWNEYRIDGYEELTITSVQDPPALDGSVPLTDAQIVAYVWAWNCRPKGYPENHALYYHDTDRGWTYLTHEGLRVLPDAVTLIACEAAVNDWAHRAAEQVLEKVNADEAKGE